MYAVIKTGGKQYKVSKGDVIAIEKLDVEAGKKTVFDSVLMVNDGKATTLDSSALAKATVEAKVVEQTKGEKIIVFKKKRRQNYRRKNGHSQLLTRVEITDIKVA